MNTITGYDIYKDELGKSEPCYTNGCVAKPIDIRVYNKINHISLPDYDL